MSVDIGEAIQEGGSRTITRNGLYFVAIVWVLGVLNALFTNSITRSMMEDIPGAGQGPAPFGPPTVGPSLGLPPGVAGVLSFVVGLVTVVVSAAAIRTFVTAETETIPGDHFTRNLLWMLVNLIVGGIVFGIAVAIGFVLLVVPGIFLLVSLFFWNLYVVVEDQNFVDGFRNSWALSSGNRIMLFVLGVVVVIVMAVISVIFGVVNAILPGIVGLAIAQIGSAIASVFAIATAARTFVQLRAAESATVDA